jgi:hypothetical protein
MPTAASQYATGGVSERIERAVLAGAGFEVVAWNDLTEASTDTMHAFLGAPPQPLGLHVFVPDFATKAANLVDNLDHGRLRLIQAVLRAV